MRSFKTLSACRRFDILYGFNKTNITKNAMRVTTIYSILVLVFAVGCNSPSDPGPGHGGLPLPLNREGTLPSGALWEVQVPENWNGDLIVAVPGYASIYGDLELRDAGFLSDFLGSVGYAYAGTSYHKNGLVLPQAVSDLEAIVDIVDELTNSTVENVFIFGASLGGLVTTHVIEKLPGRFDGGIAACGPYGDFQAQLDYIADFRVVFDYFFADRIDGWEVWDDNGDIPQSFIDQWHVLSGRVADALAAYPVLAEQVIAVTDAPVDADNPQSVERTVLDVLWYHIFATNDAVDVLGGMTFDNTERVYSGSDDDGALNLGVSRFTADAAALEFVQAEYETSGAPERPLVMLHTSMDAVIPVWHMERYGEKAPPVGLYDSILIDRYGHCNFTVDEALSAFTRLLSMTGKPEWFAHEPGSGR
jgi:pimeloyl-ACP methyl ester carboxylesterase